MSFIIEENVLEEAKNYLKEMTENWSSGYCWGDALDAYGHVVEELDIHSACHSWVANAFQGMCGYGTTWDYSGKPSKNAKNFLTLSCHSKEMATCTDEVCDAIILWVAKESPFSKYILNRDDEDSLLNGGVIILCGPDGATLAETMWICKTLRYSTEGGNNLNTWKKLKDKGVDPLLSLFVCTYVEEIAGGKFLYSPITVHVSVFETSERKSIPPRLLTEKINPRAKQTGFLFSPIKEKKAAGPCPRDTIRGFCKPIEKDDGWGGKITEHGTSTDLLAENVLKWQQEIIQND